MDFLTDLHTNQARKGCVRPAPAPIAGIREEPAEDGARTARIALREMEAALEGLREEHGQVVVMVALAGMSYQDCAKMLGCRPRRSCRALCTAANACGRC